MIIHKQGTQVIIKLHNSPGPTARWSQIARTLLRPHPSPFPTLCPASTTPRLVSRYLGFSALYSIFISHGLSIHVIGGSPNSLISRGLSRTTLQRSHTNHQASGAMNASVDVQSGHITISDTMDQGSKLHKSVQLPSKLYTLSCRRLSRSRTSAAQSVANQGTFLHKVQE